MIGLEAINTGPRIIDMKAIQGAAGCPHETRKTMSRDLTSCCDIQLRARYSISTADVRGL